MSIVAHIHMHTYTFIYLFIYAFVHLYIRIFIYVFIYIFIYLHFFSRIYLLLSSAYILLFFLHISFYRENEFSLLRVRKSDCVVRLDNYRSTLYGIRTRVILRLHIWRGRSLGLYLPSEFSEIKNSRWDVKL
jgi:hypothetical protein